MPVLSRRAPNEISAAAVLAAAFAVMPASAKMMTCSGDGMMKVNMMTGMMADGSNKMMMAKEVGMANTSMSKGDMRGMRHAPDEGSEDGHDEVRHVTGDLIRSVRRADHIGRSSMRRSTSVVPIDTLARLVGGSDRLLRPDTFTAVIEVSSWLGQLADEWAGPPPVERRPLIARVSMAGTMRRRPILHDCGDDRISSARRNGTRSLGLIPQLRVKYGTAKQTNAAREGLEAAKELVTKDLMADDLAPRTVSDVVRASARGTAPSPKMLE
jgi:hypothetical protein